MTKELTIGIPTANRPVSLQACLDSIQKYVDFPAKIIIVDSSDPELRFKSELLQSDVEVIYSEQMLSPAHARKVIADSCDSEFLLYIDDDMMVSEDSVQSLMAYLKINVKVDIVGGAVDEYGAWREIGFNFQLGKLSDSQVVVKQPIRKDWLDQHGFEAFRVDLVTQPPFLMRTEIFKKVNFDKNYLWASEIFDFFFQCYFAGVVSVVVPSAVFYHYPTSYDQTTHKHGKRHHNQQGRAYFAKKWNTRIHALKRNQLLFLLMDEWQYRRAKKKRVRKKIKLDAVQY
jgi:glycosyltransferase involved in cell wall biosynthesis